MTPIARAFIEACGDEIEAPKPGNVHVFADGHRMTADDFRRSAEAAAGPLTATGARVGERILGAVEATFAAVGSNTNLGIVLLCAPLAAAAEESGDLRASLSRVLRELDVGDADAAFRAIVRASPAGLGKADKHDVFAPPQVSLRQAMAEAANRDRIALQYVTEFADVFDGGAPCFDETVTARGDRRLATLMTYLHFLAAFPDSHIARKHGAATADRIRREAAPWRAHAQKARNLDDIMPDLLTWDAELKAAGINPGTSADLTVATLFAERLRTILPGAAKSG